MQSNSKRLAGFVAFAVVLIVAFLALRHVYGKVEESFASESSSSSEDWIPIWTGGSGGHEGHPTPQPHHRRKLTLVEDPSDRIGPRCITRRSYQKKISYSGNDLRVICGSTVFYSLCNISPPSEARCTLLPGVHHASEKDRRRIITHHGEWACSQVGGGVPSRMTIQCPSCANNSSDSEGDSNDDGAYGCSPIESCLVFADTDQTSEAVILLIIVAIVVLFAYVVFAYVSRSVSKCRRQSQVRVYLAEDDPYAWKTDDDDEDDDEDDGDTSYIQDDERHAQESINLYHQWND
jgi:hypothetical protein